MENDTIKKYRDLAEKILANNISPDLVYHTITHTRLVVSAFEEIGTAMNFSAREMEIGLIAAWFHDTGYSKKYTLHELESVQIFEKVRNKEDFTPAEVSVIHNLILSTKMPQKPETALAKALCDADLIHLGTDSFYDLSKLLKKEMESVFEIEIGKEKWNRDSYYFIRDHTYFTPYANEKYGAKHKENTHLIRSKVKEFTKQDKTIEKLESKLEKVNERLDKKPTRGVETMFRITSRNHLQLSSMADSKANIMISINTILISILISGYAGRMAEYPEFILPVITLVLVSLATIVLSVLATRPSVSEGKFSKQDIIDKKTNLLFFGNFHGMNIEDYEWGVSEMLKDSDYLYSSLTRDVFFLGKVLGRKYKILRMAYTTFMVGFVVSILMLLATIYWKTPVLI
ncbi:Metal-dependent phosphohydrolase, HD subdomain [hydrothermal vent metagenome]|uniref:Metal-dependent phosphohydrolase, HD subdomain n=1 Tax=hydrothermal vent metagenome TaxID=652676 RepID=A0A3B0VBM9_9ZZZZ